jgi:hypothetical protein
MLTFSNTSLEELLDGLFGESIAMAFLCSVRMSNYSSKAA